MENQAQFISDIQRGLSTFRYDSYRKSSSTNAEILSRYFWNESLSEALYPAFHFLEISYRNALHDAMAQVIGTNGWLDNCPDFLRKQEKASIWEAKESLRIRGKTSTEPYLISELSSDSGPASPILITKSCGTS